MYSSLTHLLHQLSTQTLQLTDQRQASLNQLADYIRQCQATKKQAELVFICTHNSRRSHFSQIAAAIAATFYGVEGIKTYSGGTEVTRFNQNAIKTLQNIGFHIFSKNEDNPNPHYFVDFGTAEPVLCFSKMYTDAGNPTKHFAAIMTCTDAEQNCPLVAGADLRLALPYKDPKASDNTAFVETEYRERFLQILGEMLYVFFKINKP